MTALVWMHRDLRLQDNPALAHALGYAEDVVVVYSWSKDVYGEWMPGAAQRWWIHEHLLDVSSRLAGLGIRMIVTSQSPVDVLREHAAQAVFWNEPLTPQARLAGNRLAEEARKGRLEYRVFAGDLLHDPDAIRTRKGDPYRVFTPFWRSFQESVPSPGLAVLPSDRHRPPLEDSRARIEALGLVAEHPWVDTLRPHWEVGEAAAHSRLDDFLDDAVLAYEDGRNRPDVDGTSKLSAYLAIGVLSPRQIQTRTLERHGPGSRHVDTFLREIGWREFGYHLLYHFPETPRAPLNDSWVDFPWRSDARAFKDWTRGRTGYAMVDAGMRQLWETGWMHNRVRMIVASFLTKDLLISWQEGAAWFWDTLIDADLASNTLGWQWAAGSVADAQPFFRIFNPTSQAERHDPGGTYIRKWVPERRSARGKEIMEPVDPMVDHGEARERALTVYAAHRATTKDR